MNKQKNKNKTMKPKKNKQFQRVLTQEELRELLIGQIVSMIKNYCYYYDYAPTYNDWVSLDVRNKNILTEKEYNMCFVMAITSYTKDIENFCKEHGKTLNPKNVICIVSKTK